jgi:alpha-L-fucosidase 2
MRKHRFTLLLLFFITVLLVAGCKVKKVKDKIELWYDKPAKTWTQALPIGNGRLGAMIYGGAEEEHLQFNEETLWDCAPREYNRKNPSRYLEKIRKLLFEGKQDEAEALAGKTFMGRKAWEVEFISNRKAYADSLLHLKKVRSAIKPGFDDSAWQVMEINYKSVWERKGLPDMNGGVFFRKHVNIPKSWGNRRVTFCMGHLKDEDFTYINGRLIGSQYAENKDRTYKVPAGVLKPGENVIAVLINNYVSTGGFNGVRHAPYKIYLQPEGIPSDTLTLDGDWKYEVIDADPPFYPQYQADYQPFGDVRIHFVNQGEVSHYRRSLDLSNAIACVSYTANGIDYEREYLASYPDNLIMMRFSANKEQSVSFDISMDSPHPQHKIKKVDDSSLELTLSVEDGDMKGSAIINLSTTGGDIAFKDGRLSVRNADEAVVRLIAETNFVSYKDISANAHEKSMGELSRVKPLAYASVKTKHLADYHQLFDRFNIDLGQHEKREIPTDKRIKAIGKQPDNDLIATYVQYARYLMLSSGRAGTMPPNLQGIWNEDMYPAWGSKYTLNINCEMNFFPVEQLNIAECHNSLFRLIKEVAETGKETAKKYYNARGWVVHHNTDQWRGTAPINASNHGIWVTGNAWLCHQLWEHYRYSGDTAFLKNEAYPLMKGAAQFFVDFLVEDPETGWLISTPSNSPEHGGLVAGPAMDHQLIRDLYRHVIESTEILGIDHALADTLRMQIKRIAPNQIGRYGQLQEWLSDIDDTTSTHRHISHLWGVHPGNEINWDNTPELMEAAKKSLEYRGDNGTGWSLAWKINFWARFLDGEHACKMVNMLLSDALDPARKGGGGSYPNLFDAHPPFQIDGNFGGASGIIEMLLQSQQGYIHLLPALPEVLASGSVEGLRAEGGFTVDMLWKDMKPKKVTVTSLLGKPLELRFGNQVINQKTEPGKKYTFSLASGEL